MIYITTHTNRHTRTHTCMHARAHTQTHTHTHTHKHTHTHTQYYIDITSFLYLHIGQPPKFLPELQDSQCVTQPPLDKGHYYKSPKCKLNELCQSMKFPSPNYQSQMSNGFLVVTVSIRIEGQEVCYSYTSEQVSSTKKNVKPCEENAAEIAYKALSELYETNVVPLQRVQSYHEPPGKNIMYLAICITIVYSSCMVFY